MSILKKKIISERTIIIWLGLTVASSIVCILIAGLFVYIIYDCWPIGRYQMNEGNCLLNVQPEILHFLPMIAGIILGTVLTRMLKK